MLILKKTCWKRLMKCYSTVYSRDIYPNAAKYLDDVLNIKESWVLAYRSNLPVRGNNTNNYVEAQFLVIKDEILNRVKEYNVVGLVDKLTTNLEAHALRSNVAFNCRWFL